MAKKAKVPVKLPVSETTKIVCTGCPTPIDIKATPSNVYVKGKPILNEKDINLKLNIQPFNACSLNPIGNFKCVFSNTSKWNTSADGLLALKNIPLTVVDKLTCDAKGGEISFFSPGPEQPTVPSNPIDDLKNKINTTINDLTKKAAELAKKAGESVEAVTDAVKKAGTIVKTKGVQNALDAAGDLVDDINYGKAVVDTGIGNFDIKIKNLRLQLKELLTGQEQELIKEKEVLSKAEEERRKKEKEKSNKEEKKKKEKNAVDLNPEIFNKGTQDAINELFKFLDKAKAAPVVENPNSFVIKEKEDKKVEEEKKSNTSQNPSTTNIVNLGIDIKPPKIISDFNDISNGYSKRANEDYDTYLKRIKEYNKNIKLEGVDESKEALFLFNILDDLATDSKIPDKINTNIGDVQPGVSINKTKPIDTRIEEAVIGAASYALAEVRIELDARVQAEIDEILTEIEYQETLKKYNEESADIQKEIDKATRALDLIGDFDSFIDGIVAEKAGKIVAEAKEEIDKFNKNVSTLNTGLTGAGFIASGFAKGDVYTHVTPEDGESSDEDGDGIGDSRAAAAAIDTSALFSDNSAITDDRNEEPKILRMFAIWDQDYEDFKLGDLVTIETIPPDTKICLVIQANGKADGKNVSVDLGDKSTHYEYAGGHDVTQTRQGLFENIILFGDSPDFENGGEYDPNDPDYAIKNGVRRELSDTTKIKLKSVLPPEEEEPVLPES